MVAVQARGRDQHGQPLEQFQRRQPQSRAAIGLGLGEAIDELVVTDLLEALQREGRPSTVAEQPFQAGAVRAFDSDRGIQREAPAVVPAGHVARIGVIQMAGTGEPAQHPSAHLLLHCGEVFGCQRGGLGEVDLPVFARAEHPIDHAAVEVDMAAPGGGGARGHG